MVWDIVAQGLKDAFRAPLGGEITISRMARGNYEPIPGEEIQRGQVEEAKSEVFQAVTPVFDQEYTEDSVSGTEIDITVFSGEFTPETGDDVEIAGIGKGKITRARTVKPDGKTNVVHRITVSF